MADASPCFFCWGVCLFVFVFFCFCHYRVTCNHTKSKVFSSQLIARCNIKVLEESVHDLNPWPLFSLPNWSQRKINRKNITAKHECWKLRKQLIRRSVITNLKSFSDIRNIVLINPKHFVFLTYNPKARQVLISEMMSVILNSYRISYRLIV